MDNKEFILL